MKKKNRRQQQAAFWRGGNLPRGTHLEPFDLERFDALEAFQTSELGAAATDSLLTRVAFYCYWADPEKLSLAAQDPAAFAALAKEETKAVPFEDFVFFCQTIFPNDFAAREASAVEPAGKRQGAEYNRADPPPSA